MLISNLTFCQSTTKNGLKDLKSIKSQNDFSQSKFTVEEIDSVIYSFINNHSKDGVKNGKIEIPINNKKIEYLGFIHPNETGIFKANPISKEKANTPELDTTLHIYKYGKFYISTESYSKKSTLNVYHVIRAINIIKTRYPELFDKLFLSTMNFSTEKPSFGDWVNSNKTFWIAFNKNPEYIATNNTIFLGDGYFSNSKIGKYKNVALVNIDSENILGKTTTLGSRPIYKLDTDDANHLAYLKDGLIESICHEMHHNYIDLAYTYEETINKIRYNRSKPNFILAEENAILNTSLSYFRKKGGLNESVIKYYYKYTFDYNIEKLKELNLLKDYALIFSHNIENEEWRDVFNLNFFK